MKQKHHMLPVSLAWPDIQENIMVLPEQTHLDLHNTLNLPMKIYKSRTRWFKMKTNNNLVMRPEDIESIWDIQKEFLHNLHRLPKRVQQEHVRNMMRLVDRQRSDYLKITNQPYDKPSHKPNTKDLVLSLHTHYIECRKECAKEIITLLKNK